MEITVKDHTESFQHGPFTNKYLNKISLGKGHNLIVSASGIPLSFL